MTESQEADNVCDLFLSQGCLFTRLGVLFQNRENGAVAAPVQHSDCNSLTPMTLALHIS